MIKKNSSVTVLTATYNSEPYIHECVASVMNQTYSHWHMYVLDDGSTDNTVAIASNYAKKDSRITVVQFPHTGMTKLAERYNYALNSSEDEFVAILDGDDYWPSDKLETQTGVHENLDIAVTFGNAVEFTESKSNQSFDLKTKQFLKSSEDPYSLYVPLLESRFVIPAVSVLIKKSYLMKIGGFKAIPDLPLCDFPTWLHLGNYGMKYIDKTLGYWRHTASQTTWVDAHDVAYGMYKCVGEFVRENHIQAKIDSKARIRFMADASYRKAVVLWKNQDYRLARDAIKQVFKFRKLQNIDKYIKFLLMIGWNRIKNLLHLHFLRSEG